MATEAQLRARLLADPHEAANFQVYADLLTEIGDERGELISVQLMLEKAPGDLQLLARQAKLFVMHEGEWLGPLAELSKRHLDLTWQRGFLSAVRIGAPLDAYESPEFDRVPVIEALLELPCADLLRSLTIAPSGVEYPASFQDCIEAIATAQVPSTLATLAFDRGGYWDSSRSDLGDLSPAYRSLRHLRTLKVRLGAFELGAIALPSLRALEIVTGGLTGGNVRSIVQARWPELERLVLYVGQSDNDYGCDVTMDDLALVLSAQNLSNVRHLALANSSMADELAVALVKSPLLPQLHSLDLSHGTFGEAGARSVLANRGAFAHLKHLNLSHSYVPEALMPELQTIGPIVNLHEGQRLDRPGRYVAIGE